MLYWCWWPSWSITYKLYVKILGWKFVDTSFESNPSAKSLYKSHAAHGFGKFHIWATTETEINKSPGILRGIQLWVDNLEEALLSMFLLHLALKSLCSERYRIEYVSFPFYTIFLRDIIVNEDLYGNRPKVNTNTDSSSKIKGHHSDSAVKNLKNPWLLVILELGTDVLVPTLAYFYNKKQSLPVNWKPRSFILLRFVSLYL